MLTCLVLLSRRRCIDVANQRLLFFFRQKSMLNQSDEPDARTTTTPQRPRPQSRQGVHARTSATTQRGETTQCTPPRSRYGGHRRLHPRHRATSVPTYAATAWWCQAAASSPSEPTAQRHSPCSQKAQGGKNLNKLEPKGLNYLYIKRAMIC